MKNLTEMTTKELVAEYNQLTGKSIKKFSDRATGEKQVAKAREVNKPVILQDGSCCPKCGAAEDQTYAGLEGTAAAGRLYCHRCDTEYYANGKLYRKPVKSASRRDSITESWNNREIAEKRSKRYGVKVVGENKHNGTHVNGTFDSTLKAFQYLHLDTGKVIAFRMALVAAKELVHESGYKFTIIEKS